MALRPEGPKVHRMIERLEEMEAQLRGFETFDRNRNASALLIIARNLLMAEYDRQLLVRTPDLGGPDLAIMASLAAQRNA